MRKYIEDIETRVYIKVSGLWYQVRNEDLKSFKNIEACIIKEIMSKKEFKKYFPKTYKKYEKENK